MLHIFLILIVHEVFTKQIFNAAIMKHAVKSKWFNINPDDLDIAVYESQKIHGMILADLTLMTFNDPKYQIWLFP